MNSPHQTTPYTCRLGNLSEGVWQDGWISSERVTLKQGTNHPLLIKWKGCVVRRGGLVCINFNPNKPRARGLKTVTCLRAKSQIRLAYDRRQTELHLPKTFLSCRCGSQAKQFTVEKYCAILGQYLKASFFFNQVDKWSRGKLKLYSIVMCHWTVLVHCEEKREEINFRKGVNILKVQGWSNCHVNTISAILKMAIRVANYYLFLFTICIW